MLNSNIVNLAYVVAAVLFIFGLKRMAKVRTSRQGNGVITHRPGGASGIGVHHHNPAAVVASSTVSSRRYNSAARVLTVGCHTPSAASRSSSKTTMPQGDKGGTDTWEVYPRANSVVCWSAA